MSPHNLSSHLPPAPPLPPASTLPARLQQNRPPIPTNQTSSQTNPTPPPLTHPQPSRPSALHSRNQPYLARSLPAPNDLLPSVDHNQTFSSRPAHGHDLPSNSIYRNTNGHYPIGPPTSSPPYQPVSAPLQYPNQQPHPSFQSHAPNAYPNPVPINPPLYAQQTAPNGSYTLPPPAYATYPPYGSPMQIPQAANMRDMHAQLSESRFMPYCFEKIARLLGVDVVGLPPHLSASLGDVQGEVENALLYVKRYGMGAAVHKWGSTDLFIIAMATMMNEAKSSMQAAAQVNEHPLHQVVSSFKNCLADSPGSNVETASNGNSTPAALRAASPITKHRQVPHFRTPLQDSAKKTLEVWFAEHIQNPYPTPAQKEELAKKCNMGLNSINNWFGNKRMRIKRKILNAESGSDASNVGEKVLAPKSKWNAVVVSKMKSAEGKKVVQDATGIKKGMDNLPPGQESKSN